MADKLPPDIKAILDGIDASAQPKGDAADVNAILDAIDARGSMPPIGMGGASGPDLTEGEGGNPYDTGPLPAGTGEGLESVGRAVAQGAAQGWQNTPDILTPQASEWLAAHGLGAFSRTGLPSYALKAMGGAYGGAQAGVAQLGNVAERAALNATGGANPGGLLSFSQLGRDIAATPEAFAAGLPGNPLLAGEAATAPRGLVSVSRMQPGQLVARPMVRPAPEAPAGLVRNPLLAEPAPAVPTAIPAPAFIPPGSQVPVLPRINALLAEDQRIAASRPAQVPPSTVTDPLTGRVVPVQQPSNPLSSGPAVVPAAVPPGPAAAAVAPGAPEGPRSVGAAASRDLSIGPLPAQTRANLRTNLQKDVLQTQEDRVQNGVDNETYVPGVQRTLAAREFSPQNSVDEKTLRQSDPVYDANYKAIEKQNNETMVEYLRDISGDPNSLQEAYDAREAVAPPAQQLFAGEKPVDASPVISKIDQILASPAGKRGAVNRVLRDVRDKFFNQDGDLEVLPSQLYGARQNITDWLRKGAGTGDLAADAKLAKSELGELLPLIDPIIGEGAPKFENYLSGFSAASRPIDQMEFLQTYMTGPKKITDANGYLQLSKVQKMLDDVYAGISKPGVNKAKSLTDDQIQRIVAVRNELQANEYKDRLARTKGSDTQQLTNRAGVLGEGPLGTAVRGAGDLAVHTALSLLPGGGFTNALYGTHRNIVGPTLKARKAAKQANVLEARKAQLLSTEANPLSAP